MTRWPVLSAIALSFILLPSIAGAVVWHVYHDGSGDAPTIQGAIDLTSAGDTVLVHDGTYTGAGNKDLDFGGTDMVVRSENGAEATVIDCEYEGRGFWLHSAETASSVIEGLTIRNGLTTAGGGVLCEFASLSIIDCSIVDNSAGTDWESIGGGILFYQSEGARVERCLISGNTALGGGGIACDLLTSLVVSSSIVSGNRADFGGGIYSTGVLEINECLISGNLAESAHQGDGGGIFLIGDTGDLRLERCTVSGNRASGRGGGICADGIDLGGDLVSTIVWGNDGATGDQIQYEGATGLSLVCCDIDVVGVLSLPPGQISYTTTIFDDPLFCGPEDAMNAPTAAGDYTLESQSPSLDDPVCGQIGLYGEGCTTTSIRQGRTEPVSWGRIKSIFTDTDD